MANTNSKKRNSLLAILLALLAAGAICVLGVAAAGYSISSPLVDSIAAFLGGSGDNAASKGGGQVADTGGSGGDGSDGGEGDVVGGGNAGSDTSGEINCLFNVVCVSSSASANNEGDNSDAVANVAVAGQETGCFLNLICLTANADADITDPVDANSNAAAKADESGVELNSASNSEEMQA